MKCLLKRNSEMFQVKIAMAKTDIFLKWNKLEKIISDSTYHFSSARYQVSPFPK